MSDTCFINDCGRPRHSLFDGQPYCHEHYEEKFMAALMSEYNSWQVNAAPSPRLRYMLGRFHSEFCHCSESYLSPARIRDRGFAFRKTETGGEFSITRHLNGWSDTKTMKRSVQTWSFNLATREFKLSGTREWTSEDPE